jgi:hypothetical protein
LIAKGDKIMDTVSKEEARVKAEKKCVKYAHKGMCLSIRLSNCMYELVNYDNVTQEEFPFADLENGDLCVVHNSDEIDSGYYFNGEFYEYYSKIHKERTVLHNATLVKKTGFNILEHLKGATK